MESPSATQIKKARAQRRLAGVNRRILRLLNELESLQSVQGVLERGLQEEESHEQ